MWLWLGEAGGGGNEGTERRRQFLHHRTAQVKVDMRQKQSLLLPLLFTQNLRKIRVLHLLVA